jgi:hypothetical protein
MPTYEILENKVIKKTNEDGSITFIPPVDGNSDYQAYLNKDKAEQSTPMVTDEAASL